MRKQIFISLMAVSLMLGSTLPAQAQTSTSTDSIAALQLQITSLLKHINELQQKIQAAKQEVQEIRTALQLTRSLSRGLSGDDVRALQEFLAEDSEVYPEKLITGFYGARTEEAVRRFQRKHGIDIAGIVGPKTRMRIMNLIEGKNDGIIVVSPDLMKKYEKFRGRKATTTDQWATSTPSGSDNMIVVCHMPPGNTGAKHSLGISKSALNAHLAHGDTVGGCSWSDNGTGTGTTTDTIAPVISGLMATSTTASSTSVQWMTNEAASGTVWYGTTTPVMPMAPALSAMSASPMTNHTLWLSGLSASTTYYMVVVAKDAAGNTATSSEATFNTL